MSLHTDRGAYRLGDVATVTLENVDAHLLELTLDCSLVLEGAASESVWTVIRWQPGGGFDRACATAATTLAAGDLVTFPWPLDPQLTPGRYRFTVSAEVVRDWGGRPEHVALHSAPFAVSAGE